MRLSPVRLADWEPQLAAYFAAHARSPFVFGRFDCALFVAGAVAAMTGIDFGEPFRGRYRTGGGALRALKRFGAGDLPATLTAALGEPEPLAWAHRGAVCFYGDAAGIVQAGHGLFVGRDADVPELVGVGLIALPLRMLDQDRAWPVPFT